MRSRTSDEVNAQQKLHSAVRLRNVAHSFAAGVRAPARWPNRVFFPVLVSHVAENAATGKCQKAGDLL